MGDFRNNTFKNCNNFCKPASPLNCTISSKVLRGKVQKHITYFTKQWVSEVLMAKVLNDLFVKM